MYLAHWGIEQSPFQAGPAAAGFYASPTHDEALARLDYLVTAGRRLGVLLGSGGTGKTITLEAATRQFRQTGKCAVMLDAFGLQAREFYWQLATGLGAAAQPGDDVPRLWQRIAGRLGENRLQKIDTVLLVDDAHHASPEVLTQITRLARIDSSTTGWTIVLAAHPANASQWPDTLRHLIDLRIDLVPWEAADTVGFIQTALIEAGRFEPAFSDDALAALHELAGGVPRQVGRLANFAMLAGAAAGVDIIDAETVRNAHAECEHTVVSA